MPLPRCQIPILTVAGLIQIAALQPMSPTRVSTGSSPTPPRIIALLHMTDLPIVGVQRGHAHSAMVPARSRGRGLLDRLKRAPAQGCHGTGSLFGGVLRPSLLSQSGGARPGLPTKLRINAGGLARPLGG